MSERDESTSRITLEKEQADAFPVLLDFVYSTNEKLEGASTGNAVVLRSLARYFRCSSLFNCINAFIQKDLSPQNAATYLEKECQYSDDKLEKSTRILIIENYRQVKFLHRLPFELFRSIVCSPDLQPSDNASASTDVYMYFKHHPELFTAKNLNELMSHFTSVRALDADDLFYMMYKLDSNEDEDEWQALDQFVKLCADTHVGDFGWRNLDLEECMSDFKYPVVEGDFRGSGRLVIVQLSSALNLAKSEAQTLDQQIAIKDQRITALNQEIVNKDRRIEEQALEIERQEARISYLQHRNASLQREREDFCLSQKSMRRIW